MSLVRNIIKNISFLTIADILGKIISFIYVMYVARYLGVKGYGELSFALAFVGLFSVFTDFGLKPVMVRDIAKNKSIAPEYLGCSIIIKIMLVLITYTLIFITTNLMNMNKTIKLIIYLVGLSVCIGTFNQTFQSIYQAFERMEFLALITIIARAIMVVGALYGIWNNFDIIYFANLYVLTSILTLIINILLCSVKFTKPKFVLNSIKLYKNILKEAIPFGLIPIFVSIYNNIDSVMLAVLSGSVAVGLYKAASQIVMSLLAIPSILATVMYPVMSRLYEHSKEMFNIILYKYLKYTAMLIIPLGIIITLLSNNIILLVFGPMYRESAKVLRILVWLVVVVSLASPFVRALEVANRQKYIVYITIICAIENVILNILLIPKFSYIGASIVAVLTEVLALILDYYFVKISGLI